MNSSPSVPPAEKRLLFLSEPLRRLVLLACAGFLLLGIAACGDSVTGDSEEDESLPVSPEVPMDGILEAVTWNLEWYGDETFGDPKRVNGPDEERQIPTIKRVMDSLRADLYALQEVFSEEAVDSLAALHRGYEGFVAPHIWWVQKTAFLYNTNAIDSLSAGAIGKDDGQNHDDWANGRFPLWFSFNYRYNEAGDSRPVYAVVIHAKAFPDSASYRRRKRAARSLYDYLKDRKPEALVLFMGDYNDDVDVSIYSEAPSPYRPFVEDSANFRVLTASLSAEGRSSTVGYSDMIDHITVSDEMIPFYRSGSEEVYDPRPWLPDYGRNTSDHFPVRVLFDMRSPAGPVTAR